MNTDRDVALYFKARLENLRAAIEEAIRNEDDPCIEVVLRGILAQDSLSVSEETVRWLSENEE